MNPGSLNYFLLLIGTTVIFYLFNDNKLKQSILLLASLFFLSFFGFIPVITCVLLSLLNFFFAQHAYKSGYIFSKLVGINTVNVLVLLAFRFINELNIGSIFSAPLLGEQFIIALGIGFYSLQNIAYQIDIYKKRYTPEVSLLSFTLCNTFFTRVSSGPILNIKAFNASLSTLPNKLTEENFTVGLQRILIGAIKKLVIAERFSFYINLYFDGTDPGAKTGYDVVIACFLFTIQLYFDFSGYMDIAIGSARMFGINLSENFNMPLRSQSVSEWWRRWHITLINWFTQYIYYPVAYKFRSRRMMATVFAIISTFAISAIWHGFGVTYLIWGGLHIMYLIIENFLKKDLLKLNEKLTSFYYQLIFIPLTFILVSFSNLFFRSNSLADAKRLLLKLIDWPHFFPDISLKSWILNGVDWEMEFMVSMRLGFLFAIVYLLFEEKLISRLNKSKFSIPFISFLIIFLIVFGVFNSGTRFIYMNF